MCLYMCQSAAIINIAYSRLLKKKILFAQHPSSVIGSSVILNYNDYIHRVILQALAMCRAKCILVYVICHSNGFH